MVYAMWYNMVHGMAWLVWLGFGFGLCNESQKDFLSRSLKPEVWRSGDQSLHGLWIGDWTSWLQTLEFRNYYYLLPTTSWILDTGSWNLETSSVLQFERGNKCWMWKVIESVYTSLTFKCEHWALSKSVCVCVCVGWWKTLRERKRKKRERIYAMCTVYSV